MVGTTRKKMSGNWKEDMKNIIGKLLYLLSMLHY